jgi:hypothetical protein
MQLRCELVYSVHRTLPSCDTYRICHEKNRISTKTVSCYNIGFVVVNFITSNVFIVISTSLILHDDLKVMNSRFQLHDFTISTTQTYNVNSMNLTWYHGFNFVSLCSLGGWLHNVTLVYCNIWSFTCQLPSFVAFTFS